MCASLSTFLGQSADLFMIDPHRLELAGALHDPGNLLARAGVTGPVDLTMVNGRVVFRDGRILGLPMDERELALRAEQACDRAIRSRSAAFRRNE